MGNCCASNKQEIQDDELNDELNTIKKGEHGWEAKARGHPDDSPIDSGNAGDSESGGDGDEIKNPECLTGTTEEQQRKASIKFQKQMEEKDAIMKAKFEQHCEEHLDLDNIISHIDGSKGILVDWDYFFTVVKTTFFWKKMRFEHIKQVFIQKRQMFLKAKQQDQYKAIHQQMQQMEMKLLNEITEEVVQKLTITQDMFQKTIAYYMKEKDEYAQLLGKTIKMTQPAFMKLRKEWGHDEPIADKKKKSVEDVIKLFALKLNITLAFKQNALQMLRHPNGEQMAKEAEYFTTSMISDQLFLSTGVSEEELWDLMALAKGEEGFVAKYTQVMNDYKGKEAQMAEIAKKMRAHIAGTAAAAQNPPPKPDAEVKEVEAPVGENAEEWADKTKERRAQEAEAEEKEATKVDSDAGSMD